MNENKFDGETKSVNDVYERSLAAGASRLMADFDRRVGHVTTECKTPTLVGVADEFDVVVHSATTAELEEAGFASDRIKEKQIGKIPLKPVSKSLK